MKYLISYALRQFAKDQNANVTIEFVILFPSIVVVFLSAFEASFMMVRRITMDRGIDMTVRDLRLGNVVPLTHDEIKTRICNEAFMVPDCDNALLLELRPVSTTTWQLPTTAQTCVDRTEEVQPVTEINPGAPQEMMLMRACVIVDPLFPTTGLGLALPKDASGGFALTATTAFVNEP